MVNISTKKSPRTLLFANYSAIEPLGLLHLAGLARDEGWERKIYMVRDNNFSELNDLVKDFKPDIVGSNTYTGWHNQSGEALKRIKQDNPGIKTVMGGPYPTYSPEKALGFVDFAVMSEGFGAFRSILNGGAKPGILNTPNITREEVERLKLEDPFDHPDRIFPHPDRETFYKDYPQHAKSKVKSIITMTGCPYSCTYCYNSSTPSDINVPPEIAKKLEESLGVGGRLFAQNVRRMDSIIREGREVAEKWPTDVFYCQDDVLGFDIKPGGMLEQLAERWPTEVGIPLHGQMRFEMTKGPGGDRRLGLLKKAGLFGLTLAIESADQYVRTEILDRRMKDQLVTDGVKKIIDSYGIKLRTEQISALPTGATSQPTPMNLDSDIALLKYNIDLMENTENGSENMMAWASTFAPYIGTKLGNYSLDLGFYEDKWNGDVPDTFFDHSVLRFLKDWIGPEMAQTRGKYESAKALLERNLGSANRTQVEGFLELEREYNEACQRLKEDDSAWLSPSENEIYRRQNGEFRKKFNYFFYVPEGDKLARNYVTNMNEPYSYKRLGQETEQHLREVAPKSERAQAMLQNIQRLRTIGQEMAQNPGEEKLMNELAPYFGSIPTGEGSMKRYLSYARNKGYTAGTLSDATRHGLYEDLLYSNTGRKEKDLLQPIEAC